MFFESWENLYRIIVVGLLAYAGLVAILRISGNRTLSKLNAFDLVVTVAFGSTLATILLDRNVSLAAGLTALVLLVLLQLIVAWCAVRSALVRKATQKQPTLVLLDGRMRPDAARAARITRDDVLSAVRKNGYGSLEEMDAVILETDGSLSVVPASQAGNRSAYGGLAPPR